MRKVLLFGCFLWSITLFFSTRLQAQTPKPKLVIGLVLDQMKWDYLERFKDRYGEGGFRRLMDQGFRFDQTFIPYVPTYTAPGHATIYTGTPPAIHGIVGNDWMRSRNGEPVYCVQDSNYRTLGEKGASKHSGQKSPKNLVTTTIGDEMKLRDSQSQVMAISLKDRGAVIPAGHRGDWAFWMDDETGSWVSSSYYGQELPLWVKSLNEKKWADRLMKDWHLLHPEASYWSPLPADNSYKGNLDGWGSGGFPHKIPKGKKDYSLLKYMPAGNELIFLAAKACMEENHLGQGESVDFLALSFSATDYAGHLFGPESREVEDMYLRFDQSLAEFLLYLDSQLGKDAYTLFLTADHGAASNPRYLRDLGVPAGIFPEGEWRKSWQEQLKDYGNLDSIVMGWMNDQIYLDHSFRESRGVSMDTVHHWLSSFLREKQGIMYLVSLEDFPSKARGPESLISMIAQGYMKSRSGDFYLLNLPGWYGSHYQTGTTHGSWNPYDTHIPLIWYGASIPQGQSWRRVSMADIAPSLAALLRISPPNGSMGEVLTELFDEKGE